MKGNKNWFRVAVIALLILNLITQSLNIYFNIMNKSSKEKDVVALAPEQSQDQGQDKEQEQDKEQDNIDDNEMQTDNIYREVEFGKANHDAIDVSLINLISTPERYHGTLVRVMGIGYINFESNNLSLASSASARDMIWININDKIRKWYETLRSYNGNYILVEGIFNMHNTGHFGAYAGSIEHITRYQKLYEYFDSDNTNEIKYRSSILDLPLVFPLYWDNNYKIVETTTDLSVYFNPSHQISEENGYLLFSIVQKTDDIDESRYDTVSEKREFTYLDNTYLVGGPTDLTYPEDGPDFEIFKIMQKQIPQVIKTLIENTEVKLNDIKNNLKIEEYYNLDYPIGYGTGFPIDEELALLIGTGILKKEDTEEIKYLYDIENIMNHYVISCMPYPKKPGGTIMGGNSFVSIQKKDGRILDLWEEE